MNIKIPYLITVLVLILFALIFSACDISRGAIDELWTAQANGHQKNQGKPSFLPSQVMLNHDESIPIPIKPSPHPLGLGQVSPTPDIPHLLPPLRQHETQVIIQQGDTLKEIATRFQVSLAQIVETNHLANPDFLQIGQVIQIPIPKPEKLNFTNKIIPDSELVYSPYNATFDINSFVKKQSGYLARYQEDINGQRMNGSQIITRVAREYSINPRLLLAVLEYQSSWVSNPSPSLEKIDYPIGFISPIWKGLFFQVTLAANELAHGYYLWRANAIGVWVLSDGSVITAEPTLNAGSAAVYYLFSGLYEKADWEHVISEDGITQIYNKFFGDPFDYTYDPLSPPDLTQPLFRLPFEKGKIWSFTGGPHRGWGSGCGWAALDFAPPAVETGCISSNEWVTAIAEGTIVFAENGEVIQDLDNDGYWQTGWSLLYMHIEERDRIKPGSYLHVGDQVGHPSCEGGVSTGTHVHIARRYNGEWVSADGRLPFVLDGWTSSGTGVEYDGYLFRDGKTIEAFSGKSLINEIQR